MQITVIRKYARQLLVLSSALLLVACASSGPKPFKLQGEAENSLNRDSNGRSLSLVLRMYQLKSPEEFNRLTFDSLVSGKTDTELLGSSLLSQSEFVLLPGKTIQLDEKILKEANFVGVVGYFRKPEPQFWRALISAEDIRDDKELSLKAQDCYLQIVHPKTQPIPGQPLVFKPDCGYIAKKPAPRSK